MAAPSACRTNFSRYGGMAVGLALGAVIGWTSRGMLAVPTAGLQKIAAAPASRTGSLNPEDPGVVPDVPTARGETKDPSDGNDTLQGEPVQGEPAQSTTATDELDRDGSSTTGAAAGLSGPAAKTKPFPAKNCDAQAKLLSGYFGICAEASWSWLRSYLAPEQQSRAAVVVDIGCNKGYSSARVFERWQPRAALNQQSLGQAHQKLGTPKFCGVCQDCKEKPLKVPKGAHGTVMPVVHCIDGSPRTLSRTTQAMQLASPPCMAGMHFHNLAFTNFTGTVQFGDCDAMETCSMHKGTPVTVKAMKLDAFVVQEALRFIDVLKIDVEGAEPLVLQGAMSTLKSEKVGFVHFEANNDPKDAWKDFDISWMVATLDDLGYSCFIEAAKQKKGKFLVRLTGCLHSRTLVKATRRFTQYNVVCAKRATLAEEALKVWAHL
ncbi:unnamed protein product [Symbiodinium sp. CCMP2456]|nr:unnamed protein product [Symbiodinium sp. CCMP2456]